MGELIQQYEKRIPAGQGCQYHAQSWGQKREDGAWDGWIEFHPLEDTVPLLRTQIETTQPSKGELSRWAAGLEFSYLEGALGRARNPGTDRT